MARPPLLAVADPAAAAAALRLVCTATYIPRAARQLAQEAGLIPWLAGAAGAALEQQLLRHPAPGQALQQRSGGPAAAAEAALAALRRLLHLRAVMRGTGGAAAVQQMVAAACQLGAATVAACSSSAAGQEVGRQVLPFLREVQQHVEGSSTRSSAQQAPPAHKRPGAISSAAVAELAAVADSLAALLARA